MEKTVDKEKLKFQDIGVEVEIFEHCQGVYEPVLLRILDRVVYEFKEVFELVKNILETLLIFVNF